MVTLPRFCSIRVLVVDDWGKKIEGVKLDSIAAPLGQFPLSGVCDGEAIFDNVVSGDYSIRFSKQGYTTVDRTFTCIEGRQNIMDIVLIKPLQSIISENLLLILVAVSLVAVSSYFVLSKVRVRPVSTIKKPTPLFHATQPKPVLAVPKYFGDDRGLIIRAIVVDGKHDLSELKRHVNLPEKVFSSALYALLRSDELIGTHEGTFDVSDELREEWVGYFDSVNRSK
jgi:hypothetical protein